MDLDSPLEAPPSPAPKGLGLFRQLGAKFFRKTLVFQYADTLQRSDAGESIPGSMWQVADPESVHDLFHADPKRHKLFLQFLRSGCAGVFLVQESEWIAHGWTTLPGKGCPPHLPGWVRRSDAYWIYNCHTKRRFRAQGVYRNLPGRIITLARQNRPGPIYVDALPENAASQHAILSAGFAPCGVTRTLKLWIPGIVHHPLFGGWSPKEAHPSEIHAEGESEH